MTGHEMPEVRFRRELRQNYLMLAAREEAQQSYEARMLAGNRIDGLLKFRIRREDDRLWFCYEITSRQPLSRLLERTGLTAAHIRTLLMGIAETLTRMEDYLLNESLVLLDPDYIYMDSLELKPGLCPVPGRRGDFPGEFSDFLQLLLGKTDHQDKEAVMLIYGLYQESLKDNYGLNDLLRGLTREAAPESGYADRREETLRKEESPPAGDSLRGDSRGADGAYAEALRETEVWRSGQVPAYGRLLYWLLLPVLTAGLLWMWKGMAGILRYGATAVGGTAAFAAAGAAACILYRHRRAADAAGTRSRDGEAPVPARSWEMVFEEPDTDSEWQEEPTADGRFREQEPGEPARPGMEDTTHTMLIRPAAPGTGLRRLSGIGGTAESIPISYYPFLIGKQENLADHILRANTVSRLHARIDRRGETYWLTDLNSTNGTALNGHLLEANETVPLHAGDRVDLADLHFQFE